MFNWKPILSLNLIFFTLLGINLGAQAPSQKFQWAVENNDTAQVARLLSASPELLMGELPSGGQPLGVAASLGNWETVQYLTDRGASLQSRDPQGNQAYLGAYLGLHRGLARYLLSKGADRESGDAIGNTLLHLLAKLPPSLWPEILSLGLDLEYKNYLGQTPFMRAVWEGNIPAADALVNEGARTDEIDYLGRKAEDYARRNRDDGMILFLFSLR